MTTTNTVRAVNKLSGPHLGGALHAYEFAVLVSGAYNTGARPNFDILAALQSFGHEGVSAVGVKTVSLWMDGDDGTTRLTAPNAQIVLSSTGNKLVTFKLYTGTGATNGDAGSGAELTTDTVGHILSFLAVLTITGGNP